MTFTVAPHASEKEPDAKMQKGNENRKPQEKPMKSDTLFFVPSLPSSHFFSLSLSRSLREASK